MMNDLLNGAPEDGEPIPITEDPMKTLIRKVIAEGRKKKEFKRSVRKHLIKTGKGTREATSVRIKESNTRINKYWKEIKAES